MIPELSLPREKSFSADRKTFVKVVLLVTVLLAMGNLVAVQICRRSSSNLGYYLLREKWDLLERAPGPIETLVVGDSSGNQGVIPAIVEERLGGDCLNLCTTAGSLAITDAWMLSRYLQENPPPERVVVVHAYDAWSRTREAQLINVISQTPLEDGFWGQLKPTIELNWQERFRLVVAKWFPLYSQNLTLQMFVYGPVRSMRPPTLSDRGFMPVEDANENRVLRELSAFKSMAADSQFTVSETNRAALEALAAMADQNGIDLYVVCSPIDRRALEDAGRSYCESAHRWLSETLSPNTQSKLLFDEPIGFPVEQLESLDHVNVEGARVLTHTIVDRILAIESGSLAAD